MRSAKTRGTFATARTSVDDSNRPAPLAVSKARIQCLERRASQRDGRRPLNQLRGGCCRWPDTLQRTLWHRGHRNTPPCADFSARSNLHRQEICGQRETVEVHETSVARQPVLRAMHRLCRVVLCDPHVHIIRRLLVIHELAPILIGEIESAVRLEELVDHRGLHDPRGEQLPTLFCQKRHVTSSNHLAEKWLHRAFECAHPAVVALLAWHADLRLHVCGPKADRFAAFLVLDNELFLCIGATYIANDLEHPFRPKMFLGAPWAAAKSACPGHRVSNDLESNTLDYGA